MTDTLRSLSENLANFPVGNVTREVSVQDERDFFYSLVPRSAMIYFSATAPTLIAATDTPQKAAGTTTVKLADPIGWDNDGGTNNRLRNRTGKTRRVHVDVFVSVMTASPNKIIGIYIAVVGSGAEDETEIHRKVATAGDEGAQATGTVVDVPANGSVELWVANETDDTDCTVTHAVMKVRSDII
jgi:hypothetical protein